MCLFTQQKEAFTAERDITVYKVLELRTEKVSLPSPYFGDRSGFFAPYITSPRYEYHRGENKPYRNPSLTEKEYGPIEHLHGYKITDGWLHAYLDAWKAERQAATMDGCMVVKMKIPKGSRFFVGANDYEICSDCLFW